MPSEARPATSADSPRQDLLRVPDVRPGASPGIDRHPERHEPPASGAARIRLVEYGPDLVNGTDVDAVELDTRLDAPPLEGARVRWINVDGLNAWIVDRLRARFDLHTLAAEDVLHVPQRAKVEPYSGHLFVVARMLQIDERGELFAEQVSFFLRPGVLISFQERSGDVWDPVRRRLEGAAQRLRTGGADYLLYTLLDALVDHCFPILEHYGDELERIEDALVEAPEASLIRELHLVKGELIRLRRSIWPMREVAETLCHEELEGIAPETRTYFRDVHDHAVRVIDILESYRELAASLTDLYLSSVSNRLNEVMKVLTILASLFIPITFLAGVYGMNFRYLPELEWRYGYLAFWATCATITVALLFFFRRRKWL